jgi:hypothetical protein
MRLLKLYVLSAFTLCLLAAAQLSAQNPKSTFENDQVLINERHGQPHDHKLNRVMIYVQTGGEILHYLDGKDVTLKWKAGDVVWSPASGMHKSEVPDTLRAQDTTLPTTVDVGIKKAGDPAAGDPGKAIRTALDPLNVDPKDFKLELANSQVRVLRVRVGPRGSVPMHEVAVGHVVVFLTDANVRETSPEGNVAVVQQKMGGFTWSGPSKHKLENLNDKPFEAVIVELKN